MAFFGGFKQRDLLPLFLLLLLLFSLFFFLLGDFLVQVELEGALRG